MSVDVVVVPDFGGPFPARFERRTLLFLACWMEYAGDARRFPLHLVCIGEPPPRVRQLARDCQARLEVVAPLLVRDRRGSNKLRGLETAIDSTCRLLLDADVMVLADIGGIDRLGCVLAAAPAMRARVPERHWRRIYPALGLPLPAERIASVVGRLKCGYLPSPAYPEVNSETASMLPYYNGGVVLVPGACDLRALWEDHMRRIASLFAPPDDALRAVHDSDQAGLATAVAVLRHQGVPFTTLPERLHATWLHLYRRPLGLDDVVMYHAIGIFGRRDLAERSMPSQIDAYCLRLMRQFLEEWRRDSEGGSGTERLRRFLWPALRDAERLRKRLRRAYRQHVAPIVTPTSLRTRDLSTL